MPESWNTIIWCSPKHACQPFPGLAAEGKFHTWLSYKEDKKMLSMMFPRRAPDRAWLDDSPRLHPPLDRRSGARPSAA